jgi:hypothetical protein
MPNDALQIEIISKNLYSHLENDIRNILPIMGKQDIIFHQQKISEIIINETLAKKFVQFFSLIKDSNEILYPLSQRAIATFTQ